MLKPVIMEEWGENRDAIVDLFGKVRDEWMDADLATWIGANRFYPGVPEALKFASSRIYIVTTKQSRFADALLQELAGVSIPPERIYGLGTGLVYFMEQGMIIFPLGVPTMTDFFYLLTDPRWKC
ncbi:hypothetical protein SLEP1_g2342 [Rubroshorea leprosula]|uniref:Uncharacterized protein n=1 Tax=Rubroshorea leprosula TaxID=152421 RepID=A0AAV5HS72_9ROSI|nr:hypothetical protein SLEP1_g2342 [Rubroshorea leprosula]